MSRIEMVTQVESFEESFPHIDRQIYWRVIACVNKGNCLSRGIHNHSAVIAPGNMRFDLMAKLFTRLAIQVVCQ